MNKTERDELRRLSKLTTITYGQYDRQQVLTKLVLDALDEAERISERRLGHMQGLEAQVVELERKLAAAEGRADFFDTAAQEAERKLAEARSATTYDAYEEPV